MDLVVEPRSSKLFARDIAALAEAELGQYLKTHGGHIDVEDPENIIADKVLLGRLKARASGQSQPIDPDDLTARLHAASGRSKSLQPSSSRTFGDEELPQFSRDTTQSVDEEAEYQLSLRKETEYYHTLIDEGGRPSHPVSLGRNIVNDPGKYLDILLYWVPGIAFGDTASWKTFGHQMRVWRHFREYQQHTRQEGRFAEYYQKLQKRLESHGFARPFQLRENILHQDKLATWIEYLNYVYQDYNRAMHRLVQLKPHYDDAWKELVESQVLTPGEVDNFNFDFVFAMRCVNEEERAQQAVDTAKSTVAAAESGSSHTQHRLAAAQYELAVAIKSLESVKRRNHMIVKFRDETLDKHKSTGITERRYLSYKHDTEHCSILIRWILQQIPLIELEMEEANAARSDPKVVYATTESSNEPRNTRGQKRKREFDQSDNPTKRIAHASSITRHELSSSQPRIVAEHDIHPQHNLCAVAKDSRVVEGLRHPRGMSNTNNPKPDAPSRGMSGTDVNTNVRHISRSRKRTPKVHNLLRKSRRIAGLPPQFGVLPARGDFPLSDTSITRGYSDQKNSSVNPPKTRASRRNFKAKARRISKHVEIPSG